MQADGLPLPSTWRPLRLETLVLLRWLAIGGQTIGVLFVAFGFVTLVAVAIVLAVFQVSASFKF